MPKRASVNQDGVGRLSTESQVGSYFCASSGVTMRDNNVTKVHILFIRSPGQQDFTRLQSYESYPPRWHTRKPASVRNRSGRCVSFVSAQNMNLKPNCITRAWLAVLVTLPKLPPLLTSPLGVPQITVLKRLKA